MALLALGACSSMKEPLRRDQHSYAVPEQARVTHVDLELDVHFATRTIDGVATLDLVGDGPVTLDTRDLTILRTQVWALNGWVDTEWEMGARDKAFLATKVWTSGEKPGVAQMQASMARMHAGATLDLMQIHNLVDWRTHLRTLRAFKAEGRFRTIGITHFTVSPFDGNDFVTPRRERKLTATPPRARRP